MAQTVRKPRDRVKRCTPSPDLAASKLGPSSVGGREHVVAAGAILLTDRPVASPHGHLPGPGRLPRHPRPSLVDVCGHVGASVEALVEAMVEAVVSAPSEGTVLDLVAPRPGRPPLQGPRQAPPLRRLGVVDDFLDRQVQQACGRAIAMLDNEAGPFAAGWPAWTPDPSWPLLPLPDGAGRCWPGDRAGGSVPGVAGAVVR
ncbi:hypothetical protein [Kitasatospora griseola]|uniref:hypothetical protein n=1 Tax=Kitasatospora griseola TaxID=2064 RepID=UPI00364E5672